MPYFAGDPLLWLIPFIFPDADCLSSLYDDNTFPQGVTTTPSHTQYLVDKDKKFTAISGNSYTSS